MKTAIGYTLVTDCLTVTMGHGVFGWLVGDTYSLYYIIYLLYTPRT